MPMYWTQNPEQWSQLKVGIVITCGLATLLLTVFFAGSIENILTPKAEIKAQVVDVKGLRKGSPVWISGIEVGSVKDINLNGGEGAIISMAVQKDILRHLKKDSQVSILTMGLLGDKYIELGYGSKDAKPAEQGDVFYGKPQTDFKDVMQTGTEAIQRIGSFVDRLDALIEKIENSRGTFARFVSDPSLYESLDQGVKSLKTLLFKLSSNEGTLGLLINNPSLYNSLVESADSVNRFSQRLNTSKGALNRMIEDPTLYEKLSEGADSIALAAERLSSLAEAFQQEGGALQMLMKDKELASDLKETVLELKHLARDLRENPRRYLKFSLF